MVERRGYRTGQDGLDDKIAQLVVDAGIEKDADLVFELLVSAMRIGREDISRGDRKLLNAALKEMRYAISVFADYRDRRKCSIFGSARTPAHHGAYDISSRLAAELVRHDWMIITGAGPGIMTAGLEGAGKENSFGVNIKLPFEQLASSVLFGDPKLVNFRYFFTRKLTFVKESDAICVAPGGFGTMDEAFEALTLMQTGKSMIVPIVLIDEPGGNYWEHWLQFISDELLADGYVAPADLQFVHLTHDATEAVEHICQFYKRYHSMRWVGNRLVLRLQEQLPPEFLAQLSADFADIIVEGAIEEISATPSEIEDEDWIDLPRIALKFNRRGHARLRVMIDVINNAPSSLN